MWDSQYKNYQAIIDYINDHRDIYHTDIRFGTLSDYFDEVNARMKVNIVFKTSNEFQFKQKIRQFQNRFNTIYQSLIFYL